MKSDLERIPSEYRDKYGLVRLSDLEEITVNHWTGEVLPHGGNGRLAFRLQDREYKDLVLFPKKEAGCVPEYLSEYQRSGVAASVRLSLEFSASLGAEIWGITFKEALENSKKERLVKSIYYALDEEIYRDYGVVVYFVINLNRFLLQEENQKFIQLQAWQGRSDFPNILYLHSYFDEDFTYCSHLDGATIEINTELQAELYFRGRKVKDEKKEKLFRLDGFISIEDFYKISNDFFLVSPLLKEYFRDSSQEFVVRRQRESGDWIEETTPITPIDANITSQEPAVSQTDFGKEFLKRFYEADP